MHVFECIVCTVYIKWIDANFKYGVMARPQNGVANSIVTQLKAKIKKKTPLDTQKWEWTSKNHCE